MSETYFVIHNSDGATSVEYMSKEEIIKRITPEDGCTYYGITDFLKTIEDSDTNYWGNNILIIKGEIVVPKPAEIVKAYEIK